MLIWAHMPSPWVHCVWLTHRHSICVCVCGWRYRMSVGWQDVYIYTVCVVDTQTFYVCGLTRLTHKHSIYTVCVVDRQTFYVCGLTRLTHKHSMSVGWQDVFIYTMCVWLTHRHSVSVGWQGWPTNILCLWVDKTFLYTVCVYWRNKVDSGVSMTLDCCGCVYLCLNVRCIIHTR